jgi:hypothetical protein
VKDIHPVTRRARRLETLLLIMAVTGLLLLVAAAYLS